VREAEQHILL